MSKHQKTMFMLGAMNRFEMYKQKARKRYPTIAEHYQFCKLRIVFSDDPKALAGQSWRSSSTIELNLAYFPMYEEEMTTQILGHELCHIIASLIYGDKGDGHTVYWKTVMMQMGFRPETYHDLKLGV